MNYYKQCISKYKKDIFLEFTKAFRLAYMWNRYKSSSRVDFHAVSQYSYQTAGKSISTSSATVVVQETTDRDQALSFFQNERILQDTRRVERL